MVRIYTIVFISRSVDIVRVIELLTWGEERRKTDAVLLMRYPDTEVGQAEYKYDAMLVIVQILLTQICYIGASLILKNSLKWARRLNPIILTLALVFQKPILPVFD